VVFGNVVFAAADGSGNMGQTIPTLSWIQLTDARGISLWQYELSIDFSGDLLDPGKSIAAMFTDMLWRGYLGCAAVAIWFLDWVISFDWLTLITGPLTAVGDALRSVIGQFGITAGFLALAGLIGALFIMRGHKARGIYEIGVSALIVALASTVLANPVGLVTGTDGLINQTRDYTLEAVAQMGDQANLETSTITSQLIETFVRQPVQVISFAKVLDGEACEASYDAAVTSGPHGYDDTIRDAVTACDPAAGAYAAAPSMGMVASVMVQGPVGLMVLIMAITLGGGVMMALVSAILAAVKAIINIPLAILPGGARRSLATNAAEVFTGLLQFVFTLFFLAIYLMVIQSLYRATGDQPSKAFAITLVFMIIGLVAFLRYRKAIARSTERLAAALSKPPGGPAPQPLAPAGPNLLRAAGLYSAGKAGARVLTSPKGRAALSRAGMAAAGTLSGNPALLARAVYNKKVASKVTGTLRRKTAPTPEPRALPQLLGRPPAAQVLPATARRELPPPVDGQVIEGTVLEPDQGPQPQLPGRRVFIVAPPPTRNDRRRPDAPPPRPTPPPPPAAPPAPARNEVAVRRSSPAQPTPPQETRPPRTHRQHLTPPSTQSAPAAVRHRPGSRNGRRR